MFDPMAIILALAFGAFLVVTEPDHARCPDGWHAEGVKPSGAFTCSQNPAREVCENRRTVCTEAEQEPDPRFDSRIYCTGRSVPILGNDGRSIGCQQPH